MKSEGRLQQEVIQDVLSLIFNTHYLGINKSTHLFSFFFLHLFIFDYKRIRDFLSVHDIPCPHVTQLQFEYRDFKRS